MIKRVLQAILIFCITIGFIKPVHSKEISIQKENDYAILQDGFYTFETKEGTFTQTSSLSLQKKEEKLEQKFLLIRKGNGKYVIVSVSKGSVLSIDKEKVTFLENSIKEAQEWEIHKTSSKEYTISQDKYLFIDKSGTKLVEENKATSFQVTFLREISKEEDLSYSYSSFRVSEQSNEKGRIHIDMKGLNSYYDLSGLKIKVCPVNRSYMSKEYYVSIGNKSNISIDIASYDFDYIDGEYILDFSLLIDGIHTVSLGQKRVQMMNVYESLQTRIESYIHKNKQKGEDWQVSLHDIDHNAGFSINSHKAQAASMIKLFVMAAVYDEYDALCKKFTKEAIDLDLQAMITVSDNDAWMNLTSNLGRGDYEKGAKKIMKWIKEHGFKEVDTTCADGDNYCSSSDICKFLESVNNNEYKHSKDMLDLLKNQQVLHKIPAGLPNKVKSASKTGELDDTENDSAIIFSSHATYTLCIMSTKDTDCENAQTMIREISKMIYETLN